MIRIIASAAEKNGVDFKTAELAYSDMFKFIRTTIEALNFDDLTTEEELRLAKTNFNMPRIFKLYTTPNRIFYARKAISKNSPQYDKGASISDNAEASSSIKPNSSRPIGTK